LGQDNFADFYVSRRTTDEEPRWTHSLELRLLAHTGIVGFGICVVFLGGMIVAAVTARRDATELTAAVAGAATLPLAVWIIHGSLDWFWETPALTAPALAFAGMAATLGVRAGPAAPSRAVTRIPRALRVGTLGLAAVCAFVVLCFPYLSVREVSLASDLRVRDPLAALRDLERAAKLNPLSADPGRLGGAIALQTDQFREAERRFRQAIAREPHGWFAWLGDGLAASALADRDRARRDFRAARALNSRQPAIAEALARVDTARPLTASQAFRLLVFAR
jgi:hypothetical protein